MGDRRIAINVLVNRDDWFTLKVLAKANQTTAERLLGAGLKYVRRQLEAGDDSLAKTAVETEAQA